MIFPQISIRCALPNQNIAITNMEIFLLFSEISDMREKSLHNPGISAFSGKMSQEILRV